MLTGQCEALANARVSFFLQMARREKSLNAPFHMDRLSRHLVGCMVAVWSLLPLLSELGMGNNFCGSNAPLAQRKAQRQESGLGGDHVTIRPHLSVGMGGKMAPLPIHNSTRGEMLNGILANVKRAPWQSV